MAKDDDGMLPERSEPMVERTKGPRGQVVIRSTGRDDSSYDANEAGDDDFKGRKMGGSVTNLDHSLTGASAVQHVKGK